jgi:hypothetical protein
VPPLWAKHDVVVVNFLNKNNQADQRVYELLDEKIKLFNGVFGASDEVLGTIESGVDFEKRIAYIYQKCHRPEEIEMEFSTLRSELEEKINDRMRITRQKVFENLDEEVHEKLRIGKLESKRYLNKYEAWLWDLTRYALDGHADFSEDDYSFYLKDNPFPSLGRFSTGLYRMGRSVDPSKEHIYRIGHPIAREIINKARIAKLPPAEIIFDYTDSGKQITILKEMVSQSGCLCVMQLTIEALEKEDYILFAGYNERGDSLTDEQCFRLFSVPGRLSQKQTDINMPYNWEEHIENKKIRIYSDIEARNSAFFDDEINKLDKWAEDLKKGLETEIKEIDFDIKQLKRESRAIQRLDDKVEAQRHIKELEKKRKEKRARIFEEQDKIEERKEELIENIEKRLKQKTTAHELFRIRWRIV